MKWYHIPPGTISGYCDIGIIDKFAHNRGRESCERRYLIICWEFFREIVLAEY